MTTLPAVIPNDLIQAYYRALTLCFNAHNGNKVAAKTIVDIVNLQPPISRVQLGLSRFDGRNSDPEDLRDYMMQVFASNPKTMTAQNTLRAALDKHEVNYDAGHSDYIDHHYSGTEPAILEAMEQHRRAGIEEVEKFVDTMASSSPSKSTAITRGLLAILKHKLTALKTNTSG